MSNYIPEDYVKETKPPIYCSMAVQDTEVVCHKKSSCNCLVLFVFICLHECNEVT